MQISTCKGCSARRSATMMQASRDCHLQYIHECCCLTTLLPLPNMPVPCCRRAPSSGQEAVLSKDDSRIKVLVVPTNEELLIARDTYRMINA